MHDLLQGLWSAMRETADLLGLTVIAAYLGNRDADAIPRRDRRRLGPTKEMAHA